ncbi:MAG: hypothetical protein JXK07_16895 [Spirochaetes bacterium]|nr:hypothetical protein [Spirochaetota bacterium]MBN2772105.1 hypothetical protein [Spirochaetota bacterium]
MVKSLSKLLAVSLIIATAISIFAQEGGGGAGAPAGVDEYALDPASEYSTADRPEDNYLARFHALDKIERLQKANLDKIFVLNVIKENFKDKGWDGDYNKVYEGYKRAMDLYYRRQPIYSAVKLEENKKHINQLYQKVSDEYKKDTIEMLNLCATHILELTLQANTASNPNSNRRLFDQILRLRVAYSEVDNAEEWRVKRQYHSSVLHYRIAKKYAIAILEDVKPDEYIGKYQVHKADNKNRVLEGETKASEVIDRKEDIKKEIDESSRPESY